MGDGVGSSYGPTSRRRHIYAVTPSERRCHRSDAAKSAVDLVIPIHQDLAAVLDAIPKEQLIPTVIDQNPCAHLRMPRDMIFHGWSMRLFQAWQHSATMSS